MIDIVVPKFLFLFLLVLFSAAMLLELMQVRSAKFQVFKLLKNNRSTSLVFFGQC
jgi:hypothetical protein